MLLIEAYPILCIATKNKMKTFPVFKSSLKTKTRLLLVAYLEDKSHTVQALSKELGLSATWIRMFAKDELNLTDVGRVETLYNYLSDTPLKV